MADTILTLLVCTHGPVGNFEGVEVIDEKFLIINAVTNGVYETLNVAIKTEIVYKKYS